MRGKEEGGRREEMDGRELGVSRGAERAGREGGEREQREEAVEREEGRRGEKEEEKDKPINIA